MNSFIYFWRYLTEDSSSKIGFSLAYCSSWSVTLAQDSSDKYKPAEEKSNHILFYS